MSKFCTNPHHVHNLDKGTTFTIPCRSCNNCTNFRKKDLVMRYLQNNLNYDSVELWTLGSNLSAVDWLYYGDKDNIHKMSLAIKTFQKRLRSCLKYSSSKYKWEPIYRVMEYGKSKYLHWHIITKHYNHHISTKYKGNHYRGIHRLIRKIWSDCIGIDNPNVNYSYRKGYDPVVAFKYVTKYLSKQGYVKSYMHKPLWISKKHQKKQEYNYVFHSNLENCEWNQ